MSQQQQQSSFKPGVLNYRRMPIEEESPEEFGYELIQNNLSESSISDANIGNLFKQVFKNSSDSNAAGSMQSFFEKLTLYYGNHMGLPKLRQLIVQGHENLNEKHVILTPGAAMALFMIATSILSPGDRALVMFPN